MAYSTQRVVSDGSLVLLSVSIGYLEREHIHVLFDNDEDALPWAWVGATNQISFSPAVPNGVEVLVARRTDMSTPQHVFSLGAQFTAESLDEDIYQILYISQEATEGNLGTDFFTDVNMHGYTLRNLHDAVLPKDPVTLAQLEAQIKAADSGAVLTVLAAPQGSDLVGHIALGAGAVATDVQSKLRESVTSTGFASLADAIAAIGSVKTSLLINSPVTVTADLTIPSNIDVHVSGLGLITVADGKRLFINGTFSAPKLHKCFEAPLLTTTITASISGLLLNVTDVSNAVLASGHVVLGAGLEGGVTIAQENSGGVGTYTLNGDWGSVASTTFTVMGASVIFGAGTVDCVYPQWFGAIPDAGVTDNTAAIRHSVYSQEWGGRVSISAGNYKVTGATVLHGGITIEGDGVADISTGSPPPNETAAPSYIWQATDNTPIWVIPVRADRVAIKSLSHGASTAPTGTDPIGIGRVGILFNGRAPQFVYAPNIENCYFFHLARGIAVNDTLAAGATNWGVNPGTVRNCHFAYCRYGILFNTDNADAWKIDQCVFILTANGAGVHLIRCGFLKLDTCFAFGGSLSGSRFINIAPTAADNPIDSITIDNCQAEFCAQFLNYVGANTRSFDINMRSCILQDGADIYLGNLCTLNSLHNHYMAFVYYDAADISINSVNDWFEYQNYVSGATWSFSNAGGGDVDTLNTYIPGHHPSSFIHGPVLSGASVFGGSGAGTPVGAVTPTIIGQEYLDSSTSKWYKANGLTNTSWLLLN